MRTIKIPIWIVIETGQTPDQLSAGVKALIFPNEDLAKFHVATLKPSIKSKRKLIKGIAYDKQEIKEVNKIG